MKTNYLLGIIMLFSLSAFSQTNFEAGYYINNNDEKVSGFIKNSDWMNNPSSFEFKANQNSETQVIGIDYAKSFTISNFSSYTRADVDIERSSNKLQNIGNTKEPRFQNERLFLKQLVSGSANLYKFEQSGLEKYFYSVNGAPIKQLIFIKYINTSENEFGDMSTNDFFRRQLWTDVKCEATTQRQIKLTEYSASSLTKYFTAFNACKGDKVVHKVVEKKIKHNLKASVSYNNGTMNVDDTPYSSPNFKGSGFGFGLEYELILPFNNNKWGVVFEPSYNTFKDEQTLPAYFGHQLTAKADISYIQLPLGIRHYFFLSPNSKIFINAAANVRLIGEKNKIEYSDNQSYGFSESTFSFAGGLGYTYGKISGEVRYYPKSNITKHSFIPVNYTNASFILRYELFGRK